MLLRIIRDSHGPGIELVTIDAGPGLRDAGAALRDGHSTSGSLGIGLGAIARLADFYDLYSAPGPQHGPGGPVLAGPALRRRALRGPGPADQRGDRVRRRLRRGRERTAC